MIWLVADTDFSSVTLDECFLSCHVYINHQLKYRFWFRRLRWNMIMWISKKSSTWCQNWFFWSLNYSLSSKISRTQVSVGLWERTYYNLHRIVKLNLYKFMFPPPQQNPDSLPRPTGSFKSSPRPLLYPLVYQPHTGLLVHCLRQSFSTSRLLHLTIPS